MPKQVGNVQLMQKMNRLKVLNYIRRNPDISRPVLSEKTGLSLASITNVTTYLLDIGLLTESGIEPAERVGRKSILLRNVHVWFRTVKFFFCHNSRMFLVINVNTNVFYNFFSLHTAILPSFGSTSRHYASGANGGS